MASKRPSMIDYEEERTSSDEDDEMIVDPHEPQEFIAQQQNHHQTRPGRPRKPSLTNTNSSLETIESTVTAPTRRRGRGPSKRPCLNRNALMARENRQRKKEYIEQIEVKLQNYQVQNQELRNTIQKQDNDIKKLSHEVAYLKTVLNNQTMITSLLKAMNDSLRRMHGDGSQTALAATATAQPTTTNVNPSIPSNNGIKTSSDILNWVVNGQTNSSKTNNMSLPFSGSTTKKSLEVYKDDSRRLNFGQQASNNPVKIARKTLPFTTSCIPKTENPPSVESILEEDEHNNLRKSSPQSGSFCEYIMDKSSEKLDNQLPTTPMSAMSNSMDKADASLSNTDFSQLSTFNIDLFDNFDDVADQCNFEQDSPDLFSEETLFHSLDKEPGLLSNDVIDPLDISQMSEAINEKTLFNSLDNTGVCLHINSSRVSLEYCSICHYNSFNSEIA